MNRLPLFEGRPVCKEEVIRIVQNEAPECIRESADNYEWDYGEFHWRYLSEDYLVDMLDLQKELSRFEKFNSEYAQDQVISRLRNFNKVFLIIPTGEILT